MKLSTWQEIRAKKLSPEQLKEIDEEVERELPEISPHPSGKMLRGWERSALYDEMLER